MSRSNRSSNSDKWQEVEYCTEETREAAPKNACVSLVAATGNIRIKWGVLWDVLQTPVVPMDHYHEVRAVWESFEDRKKGLSLYELSEGPECFDYPETKDKKEEKRRVEPREIVLEAEFSNLTNRCVLFFLENLEKLPETIQKRFKPVQEAIVAVAAAPDSVLVENVSQFALLGGMVFTTANRRYNVKLEYDGRWYPCLAQFREGISFFGGPFCSVRGKVSIFGHELNVGGAVSGEFFADGPVTFQKLLDELGVRFLEGGKFIEDYEKKVVEAETASRQHGTQILVKNHVLMPSTSFWTPKLVPVDFGTQKTPSRAIIEDELESSSCDEDEIDKNVQPLPYIRVFAPDRKTYVYAHLDDVEEYEYDVDAIDYLVLPADLESDLKKVLTCDTHEMFGDVVSGKSGGLIIFANGPTGVGKTLTAEVFAEYTKRPLYVMEMGELGTDVRSVEESLQRIFLRAARWDAVLLFDEADVLLARRTENLERSAIVSVFLRLLDYYKGVLFMTSNRGEIIDEAVVSRVTMWVDYPELEDNSRSRIWKTLFSVAGVEFRQKELHRLPALKLNGREIRSVVRLTKLLYPDQVVGFEDVRRVAKFRRKCNPDTASL